MTISISDKDNSKSENSDMVIYILDMVIYVSDSKEFNILIAAFNIYISVI